MMIRMTDAEFEEYGFVTRQSKGSPLTHEELDNNVRRHMDIVAFDADSRVSMEEYPSIVVAPKAPPVGDTIALTPIKGYCAVDLVGTAHIGNIPSWSNANGAVTGSAGRAWIYRKHHADYTIGWGAVLTIDGGHAYLVIPSLVPITLEFTGSATAGVIDDVPYTPPVAM